MDRLYLGAMHFERLKLFLRQLPAFHNVSHCVVCSLVFEKDLSTIFAWTI